MERTITAEQTARFAQALQAADRAPGTIENYLRHIRAFARWLGRRPLLPESAALWRDSLLEQGYTPGTVNSMIGPLNRFFQFLGWNECKAKQLRIQRQLFRENQKELTRESTTGCCPPPRSADGSDWLYSWKPSAPRGYGSARCNTSP